MSKRSPAPTLALCALAVLAAAGAPAAAQLKEGVDYRAITTPQPVMTPGKIEVIEFFSYACPHCNDFYPLVSAWAPKLPKDVVFRRVAVGFGRPAWVNLARAYYALVATGDFKRLDGALFHAIHEQHLPLFDEENIARWVGESGGNADQFANAYVSFAVNNETVQADRMTEDYQIDAVPSLVVNGRYIAKGESFSEILANADKLIARVRSEGAAGGTAKRR
jgi:protein dithiol oxidoreductase (disulfide-forming)